jgi:cytidyltransferase-like protein
MDPAVRSLISSLHHEAPSYVLAVTGGGAGLACWLLSVPGGSRTVLEVAVPYGEQSLAEFLGQRPDSFCSAETARLMARRALDRAGWLAPGRPVAGIACTASLRSDRPKRGDHRFHVAVQTPQAVMTHSLTLRKEARGREGEEALLDRVLLNAMAESFGRSERVEVPLLPGECIETETQATDDPLAALFVGRVSAVCVECDGRMRCDGPRPTVLLPGSFNPIHDGHRRLLETASRLAGPSVAFELTVVNADKPPLAYEEVRRRMAQFAWHAPLWLTRAPTFAEKAQLFPGALFVVGSDTAARILRARFYGGEETGLSAAMAQLREHGCRFLVAGRKDSEGRFLVLGDLEVPAVYRDLFTALPESEFRMDLSSTQLRAEWLCL